MARLIVVGSGTVVPEGDRGASSYYLELGDSRVLLDCGPGAVQSLARHAIPWGQLTDLVITHFHSDHVGALPGLFFAFRHGLMPPRAADAPLDVWGPPGTRELFERLAGALGSFLTDPGFPVHIHEVQSDEPATLASGASLSVHDTPHTEESVAVRLDGAGEAVGYTGDTGPSDSLGAFMRGVHTLVCECSLRDREVGDNHLSPSRVARIASEADPERLVLTHIYPHFRDSEDVAALVRAAGFAGGDIDVAADGQVYQVGTGERGQR